jgi:DNA mismatch repair ATPase MutS
MRQWLIRPSLELDVIEERHETVACLLRPENGELFSNSLSLDADALNVRAFEQLLQPMRYDRTSS